jgi:aspartyl-tRNA(Asn)/glutamyl-tRNA(Gln) amidotransferase subunit C
MDVKEIAKLARLEITDAEVEMYTPQMAGIVSYIEQLNELDTKGIEPMSGGFTAEGQTTPTAREDVPAGSFTSEEALSQAPGSAEGLFRVPKVL